MNTKTLSSKPFLNTLMHEINELLFNTLVFILKPCVQFIYKICRTVKKTIKTKRINSLHTVVIATIALVLAVSITFGTGLFVKNVNAQDNDILHKYYTSITVEPGDSLWSIAEEYCILGYDSASDYIEEVMHINHIKDENEIISGSTLVIPYYSEEIK